jgi:hypothetical protein
VCCLEGENLVLKLRDGLRLCVAQAFGGLLHGRDHGWGSAKKNLDIRSRGGELLLDHIRSNEANAAGPSLGRVVKNVVYPDTRVLGCERVKVLLQQNVLGVDVGKDEVDLGGVAVCAATDDRLDDLEHGCDASATSDHTEVPDHVGGIDHCALGALHLHGLTDL